MSRRGALRRGPGAGPQQLLPLSCPGRCGRGAGQSRLEPTAQRGEAMRSSLGLASVLARGPRGVRWAGSGGGAEPHPCTSEMLTPGARPSGAWRGRGRSAARPDPPARPSSRARAPASHAEGKPPRAPAWPSPGRSPVEEGRTAAFLAPWLGLRESPVGRQQAETGTGGQGHDRGGHTLPGPAVPVGVCGQPQQPTDGPPLRPLLPLPGLPQGHQPGALGPFCSEPQGLCCCCSAAGQQACGVSAGDGPCPGGAPSGAGLALPAPGDLDLVGLEFEACRTVHTTAFLFLLHSGPDK